MAGEPVLSSQQQASNAVIGTQSIGLLRPVPQPQVRFIVPGVEEVGTGVHGGVTPSVFSSKRSAPYRGSVDILCCAIRRWGRTGLPRDKVANLVLKDRGVNTQMILVVAQAGLEIARFFRLQIRVGPTVRKDPAWLAP